MPVIHAVRSAAVDGGLISYGFALPNVVQQAAVYADRILKGASPADLPVFQPTKFELAINLKTAKTLESLIKGFVCRVSQVSGREFLLVVPGVEGCFRRANGSGHGEVGIGRIG